MDNYFKEEELNDINKDLLKPIIPLTPGQEQEKMELLFFI